ncbi:MAG: sigma-70 family RNA polymerase sigma factor [Actinomycetota bacterium]|nr:sigma-70 family RNA polymerase sigma factor [Actinomycetota bacterium]
MADSLDFESFCFQQNASLIRMLTLYCGDVETARDLTQETLARAWVHWRRVSRMARPDLWVKRVAFNLANSHFRRRRIERFVRERAFQPDYGRGTDHDSVQRMDTRDALGQLTERQRAAVVLRFLEDLSVDQTAELMNCSPGTVKKLTARALTGLRELLGSDVEMGLDA